MSELSDEEKKAIRYLKENLLVRFENGKIVAVGNSYKLILLNLIETQQKEIEEIGEFVDLIGMNENEEVLFKMIRCCTHKIDELVKAVNKMKEGKEQ